MIDCRYRVFVSGNAGYNTRMYRTIRPFVAFLLSALFLVTSGAMATVRGQSMMTGQVVICTGAGLKVITVDAENQPASPAHYCPECALASIDLGPLVAREPSGPVFTKATIVLPGFSRGQFQIRSFAVQARGPPVVA